MPSPGPATPDGKPSGLASCAFARHYSRNRVCFPLLQVLRCFTSLGVALGGLSLFIRRRPPSRAAGLPHSETHGSRPADGSPWNIAVCRVLLRLMTPRHPSCARIRLARNFLASRLRCNSLQFQSSGFQGSSRRARCAHVAANGCIVYQTPDARARGKTKKSEKKAQAGQGPPRRLLSERKCGAENGRRKRKSQARQQRQAPRKGDAQTTAVLGEQLLRNGIGTKIRPSASAT